MCRAKGYVLVWNRVSIFTILVWNRVCFVYSSLELGMFFRRISYFFSFGYKTRLRVVPHFSSLSYSRASETQARVKITPREKRRHACRPFLAWGGFHVRSRLSLRKNGGLLIVYNKTISLLMFTPTTVYVPWQLVTYSGHRRAPGLQGFRSEIGYQIFDQVWNRVGKITDFGLK